VTVRELEKVLKKIKNKDTLVYIDAPDQWGHPVIWKGNHEKYAVATHNTGDGTVSKAEIFVLCIDLCGF